MYRNYKWPKRKARGEDDGVTSFTLGMIFTPDLVKADDLEPVKSPEAREGPKPPGRFSLPPME